MAFLGDMLVSWRVVTSTIHFRKSPTTEVVRRSDFFAECWEPSGRSLNGPTFVSRPKRRGPKPQNPTSHQKKARLVGGFNTPL